MIDAFVPIPGPGPPVDASIGGGASARVALPGELWPVAGVLIWPLAAWVLAAVREVPRSSRWRTFRRTAIAASVVALVLSGVMAYLFSVGGATASFQALAAQMAAAVTLLGALVSALIALVLYATDHGADDRPSPDDRPDTPDERRAGAALALSWPHGRWACLIDGGARDDPQDPPTGQVGTAPAPLRSRVHEDTRVPRKLLTRTFDDPGATMIRSGRGPQRGHDRGEQRPEAASPLGGPDAERLRRRRP